MSNVDDLIGALQSFPHTYRDGSVLVTITEAREERGMLAVLASASYEGTPVTLDLPLYFVNPPAKTETSNSPRAVLERLVADVVREVNKSA